MFLVTLVVAQKHSFVLKLVPHFGADRNIYLSNYRMKFHKET